MTLTAEKDSEFADSHFDISRVERRLVRATVKTYGKTGSYIFPKLFKKVDQEFECQQRITLTLDEFKKLSKKTGKIRSAANNTTENDSTLKAPSAKKPKFKPKDDEHEFSDSNRKPD